MYCRDFTGWLWKLSRVVPVGRVVGGLVGMEEGVGMGWVVGGQRREGGSTGEEDDGAGFGALDAV